MKYQSLTINSTVYNTLSQIENKLHELKFYWLIDSEFNNAIIEIKRNTLIWHNGNFLNGNWHYGIFKDGNFFGHFENGIWEGGNFQGTGEPIVTK